MNLSDYDPALKQGANLDVNVDLADIRDANNNELIELDTVASAVNFISIDNAATGDGPTISAKGDDTNVPFYLTSKGTGSVTIYSGASGREILVMNDTASAVNHVDITPAATGSNPAVAAVGDDTNISLQVSAKGTGLALVGDTNSGTVASGSATINAQRGRIITGTLTAATASSELITLVNNKIGVNSQILVTLGKWTGTGGFPVIGEVESNVAGSCTIRIVNADSRPAGTALDGTASIFFVVLS